MSSSPTAPNVKRFCRDSHHTSFSQRSSDENEVVQRLSQVSVSGKNPDDGERDLELNSHKVILQTSIGATDDISENSLTENSDNDDDGTPEENLITATSKLACLDGKFFKVLLDVSSLVGPIFAECQFCEPKKTNKGSIRVTSNFTSHLKNKHPDKIEEYKNYTQTKRNKSTDRVTLDRKRWKVTFDQEKFEDNITAFVVDSMVPLNIVERLSFRRIFDDLHLKKGDLQLKNLSRYMLAKKIDLMFSKNSSEVREKIGSFVNNGGFVCTTSDVWTGGGRRFLGVTASWVDPQSFKRKSAALACQRFSGTHSFDAIANKLSEIHTSFGLTPDNIRATITDNGSNFVKAFEKFGIFVVAEEVLEEGSDTLDNENVDENDIAEHGDYEVQADDEFHRECVKLPQHLRCASHTLNLVAATDILKTIQASTTLKKKHTTVMKKCNALWHSLRSPKQNEIIKSLLGVSLKRPVVTRWNSFHDSIQTLINVKDKLLDAEICVTLQHSLTELDFKYLEEYIRCTSDLAQAINLLQGDDCYYGILFPCLVSLKLKMKRLINDVSIVWCKPIVESIVNSVERRYKNFFEFESQGRDAAIAAVAYLKFKGRWIRCFPEIQQKNIYDFFIKAVTKGSSNSDLVASQHHCEDDFEFGDETFVIPEFEMTVSQAEIEVEVARYLKSTNYEIAMLDDFPSIKKVFLEYNTPLPSSAPVERLFSITTMMNLPKFNRLTDRNFERRILLKANSSKHYL